MNHDGRKLQQLLGTEDSSRVLDALRQGVTRRDVIRMLMAAGMQATLAGSLASTATSAWAQTPRRGGRIQGLCRHVCWTFR